MQTVLKNGKNYVQNLQDAEVRAIDEEMEKAYIKKITSLRGIQMFTKIFMSVVDYQQKQLTCIVKSPLIVYPNSFLMIKSYQTTISN